MTKFKIISLVSIVVLLNFTVNIGIAKDVSQTRVYHEAGKNSVHLKDCSRLVSTAGKTVIILAAAFLASDVSKFITGVCLPVDGGNSIGF